MESFGGGRGVVEAQDGTCGTKQHPPLFEERAGDSEWGLHLLDSGWHSAWHTARAGASRCQGMNRQYLTREGMWGGRHEERGKEGGRMVNHTCLHGWIWSQIKSKLPGARVRDFLSNHLIN